MDSGGYLAQVGLAGLPWLLLPGHDAYDFQWLARIANRVEVAPDTGCWLWPGVRNPRGGYGQTKYRGSSRRIHRVVYELTVGPIADDLVLDHYACNTPPCCNPGHLRPVSQRENILRSESIQSANASKRACKNGHEFTPENIMPRQGGRRCRTCHVLAARAVRARARQT